MPKVSSIYKKVHELRESYYQNLSGKESLIQLLTEAEVAEQVYNSNAIENSSLTLEETEKILKEINLDRFVSQRELFEAKNLAKITSYILTKAHEQPLNLEIMCLLHNILLTNIQDDFAGRFRQKGEYVRVGNHIATPPENIIQELEFMLMTFQSDVKANIINRIAKAHLQFEYTHPFVDGNGRIGRIINNYLLIREGYVPISIQFLDRQKYYEAFDQYDTTQETLIMEEIIGKALTNSYYKRLAYLENKKIVSLNEYSKLKKVFHSNLINKANRQTVEAFREKGIWKIGI
jgi:Fic family protein